MSGVYNRELGYRPVGRNHYLVDPTKLYLSSKVYRRVVSRTVASNAPIATATPDTLSTRVRSNELLPEKEKTPITPPKTPPRRKSRGEPSRKKAKTMYSDIFEGQTGAGRKAKAWTITPLQQAVMQARRLVREKRKCKGKACSQKGSSSIRGRRKAGKRIVSRKNTSRHGRTKRSRKIRR